MNKIQGPLFLLGGFTLAGTSVIAARMVSHSLGTFTITAVSLLFTLPALLPLCYRRLGKTLARMSRSAWLGLGLQAACGIVMFRLLLIQGLNRTSAGEAGILTGATPAVTAILAAYLLKEPVNGKTLFGITITVVGIVLLQGLALAGNAFSLAHTLGNLLVLFAAVCESLFNVFSRLSSVRSRGIQPADPVIQTLLVATIAFLLCLPLALFEHPLPLLLGLAVGQWLALLWYGVFVTALAFIFFYAGIRRSNASTAAVFSGMMPFTALVLSMLVLGESTHWQQWAGGALIVVGMVLIGGRETEPV